MSRRFVPSLTALEPRLLLTTNLDVPTPTYVDIQITNNSGLNQQGTGIESSQLYVFLTQEKINKTWTIDPTTGIATPNTPGTLAPSLTLAQLVATGGTIKVDSSLVVNSARIYLSNSSQAVTLSSSGAVSGPTASSAPFVYDFFEFALNTQPGVLNVDTTQVDQFGFPMTLQVSPADPNFPAGSGVLPSLDRQSLVTEFQAMATGSLQPFADSVITVPRQPSNVLRLLNPADVISGQVSASSLLGTITTSGTPGNWTATFNITGPGNAYNYAIHAGDQVSGPLIPAGMTVSQVPTAPNDRAVIMTSSQQANPFTATSAPVNLFFYKPIATTLSTYFDASIDAFFAYYKAHPGGLWMEQNGGSGDRVYTGSVIELKDVPNVEGGKSDYTVVQLTGHGETYNIYYPFFTTNSPAGKTTPFGAAVPPPPEWWAPAGGLKFYEPPSEMVFGADGVFADYVQQERAGKDAPSNATIQAAMENVIATALARGYAATWQFYTGLISQGPKVNGQFPKTATVTLTTGSTATLSAGMYLYSYQDATVPMTPSLPAGPPVTSFGVSSPLPIPPTTNDLLTFSEFYAPGGTWSGFASFLHNQAGYDVTIDGRAYALPYDDNGGFSSDLNSVTSVASPASVTITLGPWVPKQGSARMVGRDLLITGTARRDVIRVVPIGGEKVSVLMNGRNLGQFSATGRIIVSGLDRKDRISASQVRTPVTLVGGPGNDVLIGGLDQNVLSGGPGKNVLVLGHGINRVVRGNGRDRFIQSSRFWRILHPDQIRRPSANRLGRYSRPEAD